MKTLGAGSRTRTSDEDALVPRVDASFTDTKHTEFHMLWGSLEELKASPHLTVKDKTHS